MILNSMQNFMDFKDVRDGQMIFELTYAKCCAVIVKEMMLMKDTYFWKDFKELFQKMVETYCPGTLSENIMEEELLNTQNSCFTLFATVVDENNLSLNHYLPQRVYIK